VPSNNTEEKEGEMSIKKKILVVDDDKIIVKLVKEILEEEGFEVDTATDGLKGFEKIKKNTYDVIVSNQDMPRMKGHELYMEVRKLSLDLSKRILFISGNITDFIKSTGNRFLAKPFSHQQLKAAVDEIIASNV
jgi:DNA-binding response OmpR family regulator